MWAMPLRAAAPVRALLPPSGLNLRSSFWMSGSVAHMHFEQLVTDASAQLGHMAGRFELHPLEKDLPGQRVAVGVQPAGGQAENDIPRANGLPIQHAILLDDAHDGAADIVFAGLIKAGHLGGLAADEGAMVFGAGPGKTLDDGLEDARLELARAEIVQEKERLGPEHRDVVDTMVDQVLADGVVPVHGKGQFELGADAVDAGDEHRLAVLARVEGEQAAKPAHLAKHFGPMGRGEQSGQVGFNFVAQIDVHASAGVSFLFHFRSSLQASRLHERAAGFRQCHTEAGLAARGQPRNYPATFSGERFSI